MNSSHPTCRIRRQHAPEFKQELVALCQPGTSVSAIALAHGVNANLLRRWIKKLSGVPPLPVITRPAKLVPVQIDLAIAAQVNDAIEINIQKRSAQINIRWPGNQAHEFGQWLTVLLK